MVAMEVSLQGLLRVVDACAIGIAAHNLLGERVPHPVCAEGEPPLRYFCVSVEATNLDLQSRNLLHIGSSRRAVERPFDDFVLPLQCRDVALCRGPEEVLERFVDPVLAQCERAFPRVRNVLIKMRHPGLLI